MFWTYYEKISSKYLKALLLKTFFVMKNHAILTSNVTITLFKKNQLLIPEQLIVLIQLLSLQWAMVCLYHKHSFTFSTSLNKALALTTELLIYFFFYNSVLYSVLFRLVPFHWYCFDNLIWILVFTHLVFKKYVSFL